MSNPPDFTTMLQPKKSTLEYEQLNFAWRNFENQQAIIRAADSKAGFLLTVLFFLGAASIPLGREGIARLNWQVGGGALTSAAYLVTYLGVAIGFAWSFILIGRVITPRISGNSASLLPGVDLVYYEHIVKYKSDAEYFAAVSRATPELLLENVTDQVFALAHICRYKMNTLRQARVSFGWAFCSWLINTAIGLWMLSWK